MVPSGRGLGKQGLLVFTAAPKERSSPFCTSHRGIFSSCQMRKLNSPEIFHQLMCVTEGGHHDPNRACLRIWPLESSVPRMTLRHIGRKKGSHWPLGVHLPHQHSTFSYILPPSLSFTNREKPPPTILTGDFIKINWIISEWFFGLLDGGGAILKGNNNNNYNI